MAHKRNTPATDRRQFLALARELRLKLHEIDQKLEHLIRTWRHFHFDSDSSHQRELDD
jgi:hypothetical protein